MNTAIAMRSTYNCPQCGSSNTRALSLVYASGTSDVRYDTFYISRRRIGYIPTRGRRQSLRALLAAPPKKQDYTAIGWLLLFGVVAVLAFIVFAAGEVEAPSELFVAAWLVPSAAVIAVKRQRAERYNKTIWPQLWNEWIRSLLCQRCGAVFQV